MGKAKPKTSNVNELLSLSKRNRSVGSHSLVYTFSFRKTSFVENCNLILFTKTITSKRVFRMT